MARQSKNIDDAEEGLRELSDYDDWEESTARHDPPQPINLTVNVPREQSSHELEVAETVRNVPARYRPLVAVILVLGAAAIPIASALQSCHR